MDTFCLIFKSFGDYLLYGIGLCIAIGALSPAFKAWFKRQENAIKKTRWKSILFGISLAVFCIALIADSVRIQLVQSKQQDPRYQRQILLKHDAKGFAEQLSKFAADYDKNPNDNLVIFGQIFQNRINEIATNLRNEDLDTMKLYQIGHEQSSNNKQSEILKKMADEINRLANQLPTSQ